MKLPCGVALSAGWPAVSESAFFFQKYLNKLLILELPCKGALPGDRNQILSAAVGTVYREFVYLAFGSEGQAVGRTDRRSDGNPNSFKFL